MKINDTATGIMDGLIPKNKVNERVIEINFLFESLPDPPPPSPSQSKKITILDIGCCESHIITELSKLGFDVYGIDLRKYPRDIKNFVRCDARNIKFKDKAMISVNHVNIYLQKIISS